MDAAGSFEISINFYQIHGVMSIALFLLFIAAAAYNFSKNKTRVLFPPYLKTNKSFL